LLLWPNSAGAEVSDVSYAAPPRHDSLLLWLFRCGHTPKPRFGYRLVRRSEASCEHSRRTGSAPLPVPFQWPQL